MFAPACLPPQAATLVPLDDWAGRLPPPVMRGKKVILTCFHGNKWLDGLSPNADIFHACDKPNSFFFFLHV